MTDIHVTTPFGRRPISLGMLANQQIAGDIRPGERRQKWKLFRAVCEARSLLDVSDRALTVLDALLTFYPDDDLSADNGLVVFPSNAQLSLRARGMAPATLRRHIANLVEAGLIIRKDSANGKRYARRSRSGKIDQAYGFSLAPLLARAAEIETLAAQVQSDRDLLRITRERLTICRRDIGKLLILAENQHFDENWESLHASFRTVVDSIPRRAAVEDLVLLLGKLENLRDRIANRLKSQMEIEKTSASESQIERHKQDSNTKITLEFETTDGQPECAVSVSQSNSLDRQDTTPTAPPHDRSVSVPTCPQVTETKIMPLALVLKACPQIGDYGPGGRVSTWRDLLTAATVVRTMLNVTPSAYQHAISVLGPENTATLMACILERTDQIKSAGGYLRDLTSRAEAGKFSISPMLMALAKARTGTVSSDGMAEARRQ